MASLIELQTMTDQRGTLTVIDKILPFEIKRVYYIYDVKKERGGHRHKKTTQAFICLTGSCEINVEKKGKKEKYVLDKPNKCLILQPEDWHTMDKFSKNAILLAIASEHFDKEDYIQEKYTGE